MRQRTASLLVDVDIGIVEPGVHTLGGYTHGCVRSGRTTSRSLD
jgi:hypothetical protein